MSHSVTTPGKTPLMNNKIYDRLKWVALVLLPALGLLYFGFSEIWGFPYAIEVMASITAVDTFLGALLGISTQKYNHSDAKYDGSLIVDKRDPSEALYSFNFDRPVDRVAEGESVTVKIETVEERPKSTDSPS